MTCLAAKPIVNGIEKDLEGTAPVIRFDIASDVGKSVAGTYGVTSVPTTLVLDGEGDVVHRHAGMPGRGEVVARARAASPSASEDRAAPSPGDGSHLDGGG